MDFVAVMDQVIALLRQRGRLMYCTLQRQFQLDEAALEDLTVALIKGQQLAADEDGEVLVWIGEAASLPAPVAVAPTAAPLGSTPPYLAEKILTSRRALEGERKQGTVLFADVKGSMALLADRDPEEARHLLDPVLERMMDAVHRYEGTVNQIMGDGIMALFGAMGDTWSNIAHLLEQHGKSTQTITGHDLRNRHGAPLCSQRAPGGRLWEFASRVSVGYGPTRLGTPGCASGCGQRRNIH